MTGMGGSVCSGIGGSIWTGINTNISQDKVIALIASGTTNKFQLFPDYMMTGEIIGNRINTVINPQTGFSDPVKSRATGNITCDNKLTSIQITVKPSRTIGVSC